MDYQWSFLNIISKYNMFVVRMASEFRGYVLKVIDLVIFQFLLY